MVLKEANEKLQFVVKLKLANFYKLKKSFEKINELSKMQVNCLVILKWVIEYWLDDEDWKILDAPYYSF